MDTDKIVVLKTYGTLSEAYIIKGLLDSQGIDNFLGDEYVSQLYPIFNPDLGGVRLFVYEKDLERIQEIISAQNLDPEE
jgi:hypothetical protein